MSNHYYFEAKISAQINWTTKQIILENAFSRKQTLLAEINMEESLYKAVVLNRRSCSEVEQYQKNINSNY